MYFETSDFKIHFLMIRNAENTLKYAAIYALTVPLTLVIINSIFVIIFKNSTVKYGSTVYLYCYLLLILYKAHGRYTVIIILLIVVRAGPLFSVLGAQPALTLDHCFAH